MDNGLHLNNLKVNYLFIEGRKHVKFCKPLLIISTELWCKRYSSNCSATKSGVMNARR